MKKMILLLSAFFVVLGIQASAADRYESYVSDAFKNGIIAGNESGDFESEKVASRAEFITMTTKFFDLAPGVCKFSDVNEGDWFYEAMTIAGANGIVAGYGDGTARPYAPVTCQEAVSIIGRYYRMTDEMNHYDGVSEYAMPYYAYAFKKQLFFAMEPQYTEPRHNMTKGELLALLYKYHNENLSTIRFLGETPRVSDGGGFGSVTVTINTNRPCKVYYRVYPAGASYSGAEEFLCDVPYGNTDVEVNIPLKINEKYDIYMRAVMASGESSRVSVIKNVMPFSYLKGDGTQENPYLIYSEEQLDLMRQYPDKAYRLEADIEIEESWTAIDTFSGSLDGGGHKVSGIIIEGEGENRGLFSALVGATVKNLSVSADISGKRNIGVIAGHIDNSLVENCVVEGFVSAKTNSVGGICGVNEGTVKNCVAVMYSTASTSFAGGICGQNFGVIENCLVATDMVASDMYAGGIAGTNQGGTIKNCVFAGNNIYDTITQSSGRITTNRSGAVTENNYCYAGTATNSDLASEDRLSQDGMNAELDELTDMDFYVKELGWSRNDWEISRDGFIFPTPADVALPTPERGRMMCMPRLIKNADELRQIEKEPKIHYALSSDINLSGSWKSMCKLEGFSGTLDGRGHTIRNLRLSGQDGLFSNISGGTIRNLNIEGAHSSSSSDVAFLTGCNYGFIENCSVSGEISSKKAGSIGIITLENYGEIKNCEVSGNLKTGNNNAVIGGICANNSGRVIGCQFRGNISATGTNAVIGGISGCDDGGYLFENNVHIKVSSNNNESYIGGTCGMSIGTQIYKNSVSGSLSSDGKDYAYIGGICGSLQGALIYNCYSTSEIFADSNMGYIGGVCGCASASNVQSSYSAGNILSTGTQNVYTGGICGYAEESFVMQNAALNPVINAQANVGAVYGGCAVSEVEDNYSIDKMLINSRRIQSGTGNCHIRSASSMQNPEFYFKPLSEGGVLGWANVDDNENVWRQSGTKYPYPVLDGVKGQDSAKIPTYK